MQLEATAQTQDSTLQLTLTLRVPAPAYALVRDAQGQPAAPWLQAIEPNRALLWFGRVRVPDGLLSAAPMLPRGEPIDPATPWQRTLALPLPLGENAVARDRPFERSCIAVEHLLVGIQTVPSPVRAPELDARSGSWALAANERCKTAWVWVSFDAAVLLERAEIPRSPPRGVLGMLDHVLSLDLRRFDAPSAP